MKVEFVLGMAKDDYTSSLFLEQIFEREYAILHKLSQGHWFLQEKTQVTRCLFGFIKICTASVICNAVCKGRVWFSTVHNN